MRREKKYWLSYMEEGILIMLCDGIILQCGGINVHFPPKSTMLQTHRKNRSVCVCVCARLCDLHKLTPEPGTWKTVKKC